MPSVRKTVLLPYSRERMFALVAGVEDYPRFLPWCGGASVQSQSDGGVLATVRIVYRGISQTFSTINRNTEPDSITMKLAEGPFRSLEGGWRFVALRDDACRVEFVLDYQFAGGLLGKLLAPVFDHIAGTFVDAFVRRAEGLYGES